MHPSVMEWVEKKVQQHDLRKPALRVLEVGSRDVNGSVRPLFHGVASYTGVDFIEGPGVDLVLDAHRLTSAFPPDSFDVVVSTEMLEHDSEFWTSMAMMGEVLKPGGLLLITARGNGFWIHGYPHDYYRFLPESFNCLLRYAGCDALEVTEDWFPGHTGVFGVGRKLDRAGQPPTPQ
jgi:SAM-dependent methyltransferase